MLKPIRYDLAISIQSVDEISDLRPTVRVNRRDVIRILLQLGIVSAVDSISIDIPLDILEKAFGIFPSLTSELADQR